MEHQTGLESPDGTEEGEWTSTEHPGAPESESGAGDAGPRASQISNAPADEADPKEPEAEAIRSEPGQAPLPAQAPLPPQAPLPAQESEANREPEQEAEPLPTTGEPLPSTGEPRVDAALKLLDRLPGLPVSQHPELFEQVHAQLSDVLGELDSGPSGPAGG